METRVAKHKLIVATTRGVDVKVSVQWRHILLYSQLSRLGCINGLKCLVLYPSGAGICG